MEQSFVRCSLGRDASSATLWVYPAHRPEGKVTIVCPGGGFNQIASDHEGRDFVTWFSNQGITYAILNHRVPHGGVEVIRGDIRETIRPIRCQSAKWGIHQLGVMRASIGGYIAAITAALHTGADHPDFQVLLYSVISMNDRLTHLPPRRRVLEETIPESLEETLSLELHVTASTPRIFITLAEDDQAISPLGSTVYYTALLRHRVSAGLYIYPEGGHSFGLHGSLIYKKIWTNELQKWLLTF